MTILSAGLYVLAYPPFGFDDIAWLVTLPIALVLLDPHRHVQAVWLAIAGFVFAALASLGLVGHWSYLAAHEFFGRSVLFSAAFTLLIPVAASGVALYYSVVFLLAHRLARLPQWVRIVGFASLWTTCEYLRTTLWYGNPWMLLGHALHDHPLLRQAAALGGVWLLGWAMAAVGASLAVTIHARRDGGSLRTGLAWAVAVPVLLALYGHFSLDSAGPRQTTLEPLRVGIVQADIGKRELWSEPLRPRHFERHVELSRSAALAGADLIVWPENAVPFILNADVERMAELEALARELGAALVVGAPRSEQIGEGRSAIFNAAYFFPADGSALLSYEKNKLLPYVESIPAWAAAFGGKEWYGAYTPGTGPKIFTVKGWKIAPQICFEAIYPAFAAAAGDLDADLLLNLSNDSWFDRGAGPEQHFLMGIFRAMEQRLPVVRAASSGVSAAIDSSGEVFARLPARTSAVELMEVHPSSHPRAAAAGSDLFAWFAMGAATLLVAWGLVAESKDTRRPKTGG